jgi:hypothetical protein
MLKIIFLLFLTPYIFAAENLDHVGCTSFDKTITITIDKVDCQDERYQLWQKNGCYNLITEIQGKPIEIEMVRNLMFHHEKHQGFYSMYTYDENEWILEGFIVEFEATDDRQYPRMRFDYRDHSKQKFKSVYGECKVLI